MFLFLCGFFVIQSLVVKLDPCSQCTFTRLSKPQLMGMKQQHTTHNHTKFHWQTKKSLRINPKKLHHLFPNLRIFRRITKDFPPKSKKKCCFVWVPNALVPMLPDLSCLETSGEAFHPKLAKSHLRGAERLRCAPPRGGGWDDFSTKLKAQR